MQPFQITSVMYSFVALTTRLLKIMSSRFSGFEMG